VAFVSKAAALVPGGTAGRAHVYVRDRKAGRTYRASVTTAGAELGNDSDAPSISNNGEQVVFESLVPNPDPQGTPLIPKIFLRSFNLQDRQTGTTTQLDLPTSLNEGKLIRPAISDDGWFIKY